MAPPEFLIFAGVEFKDKIDWIGPIKEKAVQTILDGEKDHFRVFWH